VINCTWVGTITGNYGVQGQLKRVLDTEIKNLDKGTWLFLEIQRKPVPFFIEDTFGQESSYVTKLRGIETPEQCREYYNLKIGVQENQLLESRLNDLLQLIDFKIIDSESNDLVGVIEDIYDNSAHLLAKVIYNENELLVPLHSELVINVNEEEKEITLQMPEGLINL